MGAKRDSAPACAPLPTISAIRNGGIAARLATAMAIGAMIAVVAMLPGPMLDSVTAMTNSMIGITPALPRQARTARAAMRPSVPLLLAMPNSSVMPTRLMQEIDRKGADHLRDRHAAQVDTDDPSQGQRHHADVDARHHAQGDGDNQRGQRNPGKVHRVSLCLRRSL